jgi:adenosylmethionine-8-amino-7-oxononanoate aminotransferase
MLGGIDHPQAVRLADRLARLMPGSLNHSFFCDSGSVAVEVAMKMAVQFWMNRGELARKRFVCLRHSYHGDTSGAMSVCDPDDSMHRHFRGFLLEQYPHDLPVDDAGWQAFARFLEQVGDQCAGVIVEPLVQAATGIRFHSPEQLRRLADLARHAGLLFIADEIQTDGLMITNNLQSELQTSPLCVVELSANDCLIKSPSHARVYPQNCGKRQSTKCHENRFGTVNVRERHYPIVVLKL